MPSSRRSFRRTVAFAAATLLALTLFAVTPMISSNSGVAKPSPTAPF